MIGITKKDLFIWLIMIFFVPIILTIVMILQWDPENAIVMSCIIGVVWLIAIIITYFVLKEVKNNPYPFSYLIDYDTLINYMQEEEQFCFDNKLEASFHFYLYQGKEKIEVQSWHYSSSNFETERSKGNIYYWNKEEFYSLDSLIDNKIKKFDGYVLVELIDCDNVKLNEFKNNHKELDVAAYIEKLN